MKVLHYSLGLPPFRSGGLTKYSLDLMKTQLEMDYDIHLLFPSNYFIFGETKVKYSGVDSDINVWELFNPLPVPLLNGISQPKWYMKEAKPSSVYIDFLKKLKPDIIHIHTLMGIHKEFFIAAKDLNIKMVFTTHDYYGLSTLPNPIEFSNEFYSSDNALSIKSIMVLQSSFYRLLKEHSIMKKIRSWKKSKLNESVNASSSELSLEKRTSEEFSKLRDYYTSIFQVIDRFHFNSTVSESVFLDQLSLEGKVIPISHMDIKDTKTINNTIPSSKLRFLFLGPVEEYKGLPLLLEVLEQLYFEGYCSWTLEIYGNSSELKINDILKNNVTFNGRYSHEDLKTIFSNSDLLFIPSVWKETFGFIGLEAYSYGVPTLVSTNVGFKDLISNCKTGFVVSPTHFEMHKVIKSIIENPMQLKTIHNSIIKENKSIDMKHHVKQIENFYLTTLGVSK